MIHDKFSKYENRIAVGIVGEGSDCFGFDDEISKDHDYGLGFCMWLTDSDYEEIGRELQEEYEKLFFHLEESNTVHKEHLSERRGVYKIDEFYEMLLQIKPRENHQFLKTIGEWLSVEEDRLALCVNGCVFRDDIGVFTSIREYISSYYPKRVWRVRLAEQIHHFSQNAQYNYSRMMARGDDITSQICVMQAVKAAMSIVYLLNRTYAPYYKWMKKGMEHLEKLTDIIPLLDEISILGSQKESWNHIEYKNYNVNKIDKKVVIFEKIAEKLVEELNQQKIISGKNNFLDIYCMEIANEEGDR